MLYLAFIFLFSVWTIIRSSNMPYCSLYNKGYTSIGNIDNTIPNSALCTSAEGDISEVYKPAYELLDIELERTNRVQK